MAAKLVDLGVDILEAGFPIASDGDSKRWTRWPANFRGCSVAALARVEQAGHLSARPNR